MFVFLKKIEFYKDKSDREAIVIAAEGAEGGGGIASHLKQSCFSIMGALPFHQIFPLPTKVLVPPIFTWNGEIEVKKFIKILVNSQGNLNDFLHSFTRICNSWLQKPAADNKMFVLRYRTFRGIFPLSYWRNTNGKPWWIQGRAMVGFQEAKLKKFWHFNVFKAIKWFKRAFENYIYGCF